MAKLVFHVGMQKTGSTAIQSSLHGNTRSDYVYPRLGSFPFKNQHTDALVKLFSSKADHMARKYRSKGKLLSASDEDEDRIRQAAKAAGDSNVILSSESAYDFLTKADLLRLKRFTDELFEMVTIVGYARDPFEAATSGLWTRISSYPDAPFAPHYGLYQRFKKFDDTFGRSNVKLFKFDRTAFPNGDVVRHFCSLIGIEPISSANRNVTVSRVAASAVYRLNRLVVSDEADIPTFRILRKALIKRFPHDGWPKFRLSPELVEPLFRENSDDLAWIEDRLGSGFRQLPDRHPDDIRTEDDLLSIDAEARVALLRFADTVSPKASALLHYALAERQLT